ncbi:MAG: hypothetical protein K0R45_1596, partial [Pseudomonas sp.]|nr:hypothetical protein [Pseudomonas sp.]
MRNSSTLKNNRLLKPWALTGAAVAVSGLLWGAFQSEDVFQPDGREPDFVSANYAELLLAARPDDHQLRMRLIDLLIRLGDYPKARRYLKDWAAPQPQLQAFYALKLDVAEQNTHAADPRHLLDQLKGIDHHNLPLPQQQELASLALAMQAPAYAASVYEDIAARDPAQRDASRLAAAQWYLAGEQPERAADIYVQMRDDQTAAPERRTYARQAFDSFLAANRGEQAAQVLADELERLDDPQADAAWLEQGITTAVQSRRFDLAQRMLDRWRILQPDNPHILPEEFNVRLAFGDLEGAWASGQQLLAANPNDLQLLEKMAHLGEWRNDPAAALDLWLRLLERQDTRQTREHAWQLASQQADFEKMIPLLEDIMQQRALTDAELDALLYAYEAQEIQPPENQAAAWLSGYTERYPEHRHAWTRLLQNLENSKAYAAKAQVYARLSERFELTP